MFIWKPPPLEAPDREPETRNVAPNKAIRDFAGLPLRWVQRRRGVYKQSFEMRCGEAILALMLYERSFFWETHRGRAETTEGSWSFRSEWKVEIGAVEGNRRLATLECKPGGSEATLSLPNGHNYVWQEGRKEEGGERRWLTGDGVPLMIVRAERLTTGIEGDVGVQSPAAALPELGLLITLGWYLVVCAMNPEGVRGGGYLGGDGGYAAGGGGGGDGGCGGDGGSG